MEGPAAIGGESEGHWPSSDWRWTGRPSSDLEVNRKSQQRLNVKGKAPWRLETGRKTRVWISGLASVTKCHKMSLYLLEQQKHVLY